MADRFDVQAQFNDGEHQRLKVWYLCVTLRGIKDQLNEFNQGVNPGDTRRVEYVRYKRPTLDDNVRSMFWEHNMFK